MSSMRPRTKRGAPTPCNPRRVCGGIVLHKPTHQLYNGLPSYSGKTMKKRTRIKVVVLIAAVIGVLVWLVVRWNAASRTGIVVTTTGPLDIRLWGIRPNAGDAIYDPNGKEIRRTLGSARWGNPYWADSDQRFDFIFELGDSNEPPLMGTFPRLEVSGTGGKRHRHSFRRWFRQPDIRLQRQKTAVAQSDFRPHFQKVDSLGTADRRGRRRHN